MVATMTRDALSSPAARPKSSISWRQTAKYCTICLVCFYVLSAIGLLLHGRRDTGMSAVTQWTGSTIAVSGKTDNVRIEASDSDELLSALKASKPVVEPLTYIYAYSESKRSVRRIDADIVLNGMTADGKAVRVNVEIMGDIVCARFPTTQKLLWQSDQLRDELKKIVSKVEKAD